MLVYIHFQKYTSFWEASYTAKYIFQPNTRRIKSFFPYKDRLNRGAIIVIMFTFEKPNEDSMIETSWTFQGPYEMK